MMTTDLDDISVVKKKLEEAEREVKMVKAALRLESWDEKDGPNTYEDESVDVLKTLLPELLRKENLLRAEKNRLTMGVDRASRDSQGRSDVSNHSANLIQAWAIRATIEEKETNLPCFFRMRLSQKLENLKEKLIYVYGSCECEGRTTNLRFLVETHQHRTTVCNEVLAVAKMLQDGGYLENFDAVKGDLAEDKDPVFVTTDQLNVDKLWTYRKQEGSPNEKYEENRFQLVDASDLSDVSPVKLAKSPLNPSTPSRTSVDEIFS